VDGVRIVVFTRIVVVTRAAFSAFFAFILSLLR
jgi:hypothetical protein